MYYLDVNLLFFLIVVRQESCDGSTFYYCLVVFCFRIFENNMTAKYLEKSFVRQSTARHRRTDDAQSGSGERRRPRDSPDSRPIDEKTHAGRETDPAPATR